MVGLLVLSSYEQHNLKKKKKNELMPPNFIDEEVYITDHK